MTRTALQIVAAMYDVSEGLKKEPLDQIRIETR